MPNKQATTLDFPGSHLPKQDTVKGGGAPAPSDRNPGLLHPTPGLEWGAPPAPCRLRRHPAPDLERGGGARGSRQRGLERRPLRRYPWWGGETPGSRALLFAG